VEALREGAQFSAPRLPEDGLDVEREREFDGLARRARRRDDDDAAGRPRGKERFAVGREVRVPDWPAKRLVGYCRISGLPPAGGGVTSGLPAVALALRVGTLITDDTGCCAGVTTEPVGCVCPENFCGIPERMGSSSRPRVTLYGFGTTSRFVVRAGAATPGMSPNSTLAAFGMFFTALAQSVAAGC
jgi:hypothetical protein